MEKKNIHFNKALIFPLLIGVAIVFVILQFTVPQIKQIMQARQELKAERGRLDQLVKKATALEELNEESLTNNFKTSQDALPSEKDVAGILYTLARLENETRVSIGGVEFKPGLISTPSATPLSPAATPSAAKSEKPKSAVKPAAKPAAPAGPATIALSLDVSGDFSSVRNFLTKVREVSPLLTISSVDFSVEGSGVSASFDLSFNYQLLPATYIKVDDPLPDWDDKDEDTLAEIANFPVYNEISSMVTVGAGKTNPFE